GSSPRAPRTTSGRGRRSTTPSSGWSAARGRPARTSDGSALPPAEADAAAERAALQLAAQARDRFQRVRLVLAGGGRPGPAPGEPLPGARGAARLRQLLPGLALPPAAWDGHRRDAG